MVPVVQNLLGPGSTVTGMSGKLIVRATPQELDAVHRILDELDSPLQNLRITVRQALNRQRDSTEAELSADVEVGDRGRVRVGPGAADSGGLSGTVRSGKSEVTTRFRQDHRAKDGMDTQQVITLEGKPALIHITQFIPFTEVHTSKFDGKIVREETVVFRDVTTGLSVLPRVTGDQVVLEVRPVASEIREGPSGIIESSGVVTTVTGRLGRWIELGGLSQTGRDVDRETGGARTSGSREQRKIYIKVEKMR